MSLIRCKHCDALLSKHQPVQAGLTAYCPCCQSKLGNSNCFSLSGELALTVSALLLFIPAQMFSLISIDLLGVNISMLASSGAWVLINTYPLVALLVIFCIIIAPLGYLLCILIAHYALYQHSVSLLRAATQGIHLLRQWVMLDVFLVSLGIACFKVIELATLTANLGLVCFVALHLILTLLLSRLSISRYWNTLPTTLALKTCCKKTPLNQTLCCPHCDLIQSNKQQHCLRCALPVSPRKKQSLQKAWACLITAVICIFPANLYAISVLLQNGNAVEDTIISGVIKLINSQMYGIAAIIFTASVLVPVAKILGLVYILCCIHFNYQGNFLFRAKLYRFVHLIGKWSMMDLFVISIMASLIARDNLLGFAPGPAAAAFGLVVIFTMLAADFLDPRLIWDGKTSSKLAKFHRQAVQQSE